MPDPIPVSISTRPVQLWSGRSTGDINTLLLMNTDINNTVKVGTGLQSIVVPIAPNGSLSVDPSSNWYAVGLVAGSAPLVVVPNGQSNFLGLTQGLGSLAIPSIRSPNFNLANPAASPNPSWGILQNGLAYFVGLTLFGGVIIGPDYIVNTSGFFFYTGTPALGNLSVSITSAGGIDQFGNVYQAQNTVYGPNGSYVNVNSTGGFFGSAGVLFHPQSAAHLTAIPQSVSNIVNAGLVNEQEGLTISSGKANSLDDAVIQLLSESSDGTLPAELILEAGGTFLVTVSKAGLGVNVPVTANSGTTATPTNITSDTWHQQTVFNNGWIAQNAGFWYRLTNDKELEIVADLSGGPIGNSSVLTFSGIYVPNLSQNHPTGQNNPGGTSPPWVFISNAGVLSINAVPVAGEEVFFHIFVPVHLVNGGFG